MLQEFDYLVFDSLTNLFIYHGEAPVEHFIQNLVDLLAERNCRGIFFALKESITVSSNSPLMEITQPRSFQTDRDPFSNEENIWTSRISDGMNIIDLG